MFTCIHALPTSSVNVFIILLFYFAFSTVCQMWPEIGPFALTQFLAVQPRLSATVQSLCFFLHEAIGLLDSVDCRVWNERKKIG